MDLTCNGSTRIFQGSGHASEVGVARGRSQSLRGKSSPLKERLRRIHRCNRHLKNSQYLFHHSTDVPLPLLLPDVAHALTCSAKNMSVALTHEVSSALTPSMPAVVCVERPHLAPSRCPAPRPLQRGGEPSRVRLPALGRRLTNTSHSGRDATQQRFHCAPPMPVEHPCMRSMLVDSWKAEM